MLNSLYIENFAIIDKINVDFTDGLNIITGETGSGKSILIEAFELLLGQRFNKSFIRDSSKKTIVEATFTIADNSKIKFLEDMGYNVEDGVIIISRIVDTNLKSINKLNNRSITLNTLNELMSKFVDIHGQNGTQSLLNKDFYLDLIDSFDKEETFKIKTELREILNNIAEYKKAYKSFNISNEEKDRQLDIINYQIEEISQIDLENLDEEELENEYNKLSNVNLIKNNIGEILNMYSDENYNEQDINTMFNIVLSKMDSICEFDNEVNSFKQDLDKIYYEMDDLFSRISSYSSSIYQDEFKLNDLENKIAIITNLKRKYGKSIDDIISFRKDLERRLKELNEITENKRKFKKLIDSDKQKGIELSDRLHKIRKKIVSKLEKLIVQNLKDLNMKHADFQVKFEKLSDFNEKGYDSLDFLIKTNLGQDLKPMVSIASGGEISRIMLGFKSVISDFEDINTLIFDEIDTGISGRTALVVGEKLIDLSKDKQVISISHLPQIASLSDNHILIEKIDCNNETKSILKVLTPEEKVNEISRLIGGINITETTIEQAKLMINQANELKNDRR
ncbi:DNA repair protein RecN [Finegoldia sp. BIOML-A2]|uniref:DNA repair protein RecN n=1 Tax=Finegoldia TaxID=150022 RepID=UPI000B91CA8C|nr:MULTISPECIES: DNA repair protein RecN [Finegoldia]MDU2499446.1 DNA repair protein RecN [Finegoldia magna]MSA97023.1 DNA repair protein RecN [Finegoldia sp. BIOML-A5]MSA98148.1 DNA repair protein RecN [Finegoldia sp. BIOML-A3]MSB00295.1 DNA repair protein RecN [Finegoldia sp. BIOML-A2]MSB92156.1 DNA repair protein RecN [Finegoldia sp. BIOML-A4]